MHPFGTDLNFNENPFPVRMGRYSQNFFQADLTVVVTAESHPPSASNISPNRIYLPFPAIPHYQYPDANLDI